MYLNVQKGTFKPENSCVDIEILDERAAQISSYQTYWSVCNKIFFSLIGNSNINGTYNLIFICITCYQWHKPFDTNLLLKLTHNHYSNYESQLSMYFSQYRVFKYSINWPVHLKLFLSEINTNFQYFQPPSPIHEFRKYPHFIEFPIANQKCNCQLHSYNMLVFI